MPTNVFSNPAGNNDCLNYLRAPNKTQRATTFAAVVPVTLRNPQRVINNQSADAVIYLQLRGDSGYTPYQFQGFGQLVCDPINIGIGTTSTDVIVNGID